MSNNDSSQGHFHFDLCYIQADERFGEAVQTYLTDRGHLKSVEEADICLFVISEAALEEKSWQQKLKQVYDLGKHFLMLRYQDKLVRDKLPDFARNRMDVVFEGEDGLAGEEGQLALISAIRREITHKFDVFISHARVDKELVQKLYLAFDLAGLSVWVDWQGIAKGSDFYQIIQESIDQSNTFLFVRTPHSMRSHYCNLELEYAFQQGKFICTLWSDWDLEQSRRELELDLERIQSEEILIPLTPAEEHNPLSRWDPYLVESTGKNVKLARDNSVALDRLDAVIIQEELTDELIQQLVATILQDPEYRAQHTDYLLKAKEWIASGKNADYLLRGENLNEAREWRNAVRIDQGGYPKFPLPTQLHRDYIEASISRKNRIYFYAFIITVIAIIVLSFLLLRTSRAENLARQEANIRATAEQVAIQERDIADNRLQSSILENRIEAGRQPIGRGANQPLLVGDSWWISHRDDGSLWQLDVSTGNPVGEPILVGTEALAPVSDGHFIWIASQDLVTRIDPLTHRIVQTVDLVDTPIALVFADDYLWVVGEKTIAPITAEGLGQEIQAGRELFEPQFDNAWIWAIDRREDKLIRFQPQTEELVTLEFDSGLQTYILQDNLICVLTENSLVGVDKDTMTITQEVPFEDYISFAQSGLWIIGNGASTLYEISNDCATISNQLDLPYLAKSVHIYDNYLWVITREDYILAYDLTSLDLIWSIPFPNSGLLGSPVFTGNLMWLADSSKQYIASIDPQYGIIRHEIDNCNQPNNGVFDGSNLWFVCQGEEIDELIHFPAMMFYHGLGENNIASVQNLEMDSRPHMPIFDGRYLWIIQEAEGVLLVYDPLNWDLIGAVNVGVYPALPILHQGQLWVSAEFEIFRFDTQAINMADYLANQDYQIYHYDSEVGTLFLTEHFLWITLGAEPMQETPPDVARIDLQTYERQANMNFGAYWTGLSDGLDGTIWAIVVTNQTGWLVQFDELSGSILRQVDIRYIGWIPLLTDDSIIIGGAVKATATAQTGCLIDASCQGDLIWLDRETLQPLYSSPEKMLSIGRPFIAAEAIWYLQSEALPVITAPYGRGYKDLVAMNQTSKEIEATFSPCNNILPPYYDAETDLIWIACIGLENDPGDLWVIDASERKVVKTYHGLGQEAWPITPICNTLWVVYRDSGRGIVFNSQGDMLTSYELGDAPSRPAMDGNNRVWIANSGDGTVQAIQAEFLECPSSY